MGTTELEPQAVALPRSQGAVLFSYALIVLLVGSNAVAVRFTVAELPPFWGATLRFAAAALIFWVFVLVRRIDLPRGRALVGVLLYGFLNFGATYALLYWGLRTIPAGLTQVILALVPLMTFFAAYIHGLEAFRWRGLLGAGLAMLGIVLAFFNGKTGTPSVWPLLAVALAAACIAEGTVVVKLYPRSDAFAANALGMTVGTLTLLILSLAVQEPWTLPHRSATWLSTGYLVLFGSVMVFWLFLYILSHWTASAASYQFVLFPFVTVLVAGWLAGETVGLGFLLGALIVLAGVWLGAFSSRGTQPSA